MISRSSRERASSRNSRGVRFPLWIRKAGSFSMPVCTACADPRNEDEIIDSQMSRGFFTDGEGQHPPVDQVAPVPFGGILQGDVRLTPEYLLAGCRLLPGGAVARLDREYHAPQPGIVDEPAELLRRRFSLRPERGKIIASDHPSAPPSARSPSRLDSSFWTALARADVPGIFPRQGELGEFQRIGTIGGRLSGRDQLIGRRDRIADDRGNPEQQVLGERLHLRPVGDVRSETQLIFGMGVPEALVDPVVVDLLYRRCRPPALREHRPPSPGSVSLRSWPWRRWSGHPSGRPRPVGPAPVSTLPGSGSFASYAGCRGRYWPGYPPRRSRVRRKRSGSPPRRPSAFRWSGS